MNVYKLAKFSGNLIPYFVRNRRILRLWPDRPVRKTRKKCIHVDKKNCLFIAASLIRERIRKLVQNNSIR